MLSIGSVETFPELQAECTRVLSIQDVKMKDVSIACLIKQAEARFERSRPFNHSEAYHLSIKSLCGQFTDPFLKAYFTMQFIYWNVDLNYPADRITRTHEYYHRIVENPLNPDQISKLLPHLNNIEETNSESRLEIFTTLLFSYLGNGHEDGAFDLFEQHSDLITRYLFNTFLIVAKNCQRATKTKLRYVCKYMPEEQSKAFIRACLNKLTWNEINEIKEYVEEFRDDHPYKIIIQAELEVRIKQTKLL